MRRRRWAAVSRDGDCISVHLGFDRETPFVASTHTCDDGTGTYTICPKQDGLLRVRVPEFVSASSLHARADGEEISLVADGPYVRTDNVARGSTVTITYPLEERTEREIVPVCEEEYELKWLGTDVAAIDPQGKHLPLFQGLSHPEPSPGAAREQLRL